MLWVVVLLLVVLAVVFVVTGVRGTQAQVFGAVFGKA